MPAFWLLGYTYIRQRHKYVMTTPVISQQPSSRTHSFTNPSTHLFTIHSSILTRSRVEQSKRETERDREKEIERDSETNNQHTIIFSNRARISFSEVIFEDNSSSWEVVEEVEEGVDQSVEPCFAWAKWGRSFLLPGIRILANLSSCTETDNKTSHVDNMCSLI